MRPLGLVFLLPIALVLESCSSSRQIPETPASYYEIPAELKNKALEQTKIESYAPCLKGVGFFIDPGHGGSDRAGKNSAGNIVEADLNLKVAAYLKSFLEQAGAKVILSRTEDKTVPLKDRSMLANQSGADFFLSIHHNAAPKDSDSCTDYTSTYFHATENDSVFEPSNRDMARFIQRDLAYALRNSGGLGSFDGTYSDYSVYPAEGFSVLRLTSIPSVLVECAFFSSRMESGRLGLEEFNKVEAWGIFKGIGRYLTGGIPKIRLVSDKTEFSEGSLRTAFLLSDRSGIIPSSIRLWFDSEPLVPSYNQETGTLSVDIKDVPLGSHCLRIDCQNAKGNHCLPYRKRFLLKS